MFRIIQSICWAILCLIFLVLSLLGFASLVTLLICLLPLLIPLAILQYIEYKKKPSE